MHRGYPLDSGYGQQTAQLVRKLKQDHDVIVSAFYGLGGGVLEWEGVPVYPGYRDPFGNDVLPEYVKHLEADWTITLMDVYVLTADVSPVACWTPVDHDPAPPAVVERLKRPGVLPIAMSRWGQAKLQEAGVEARYVPHAIDTETFQPYDHLEAQKSLGVDGRFVVGIVAANRLTTYRKGLPEAFEAFARFHEREPDSVLLAHTEKDERLGGAALSHLAECVGIADAVMFRDQMGVRLGLRPEQMAVAYSAMDVLLNCSYGEGFGIPIIEAQASGTPVVTTNFSAMPELVKAGWLVEGEPFWDSQKAWFRKPSIEGIVEALEAARSDALEMRALARYYARRYDIEYVWQDYWTPVLEEMERKAVAA